MTLNELIEDQLPVFEMANLDSSDTGFPGTVYISTKFERHSARVKWYPGRNAGDAAPCIIVPLVQKPNAKQKYINKGISQHEADQAYKNLEIWIEKNRTKILKFWDEGTSWTRHEVSEFLNTFEKI